MRDANCGYLVKYGDVNDLGEKMNFVIENPNKCERLVETGRKYIEENLAWDKIIHRFEKKYEKN